uniref:Cytochrome c oxidase subunit 7A2, mitochondrial n=1 Tax=Sciurus vulgaris TaxID=55149 RepID=A0A8D2CRT5_SCIVU
PLGSHYLKASLILLPFYIPIASCKWVVTAKMLWNLLGLPQISQRTISNALHRHFENKILEKQQLFQENNGIPVHLKGGMGEGELILSLYAIYQLTMVLFPKEQD